MLERAGAEWVQIDEPCLVLDLDDDDRHAFRYAYRELADAARPKLLLTTYFGANYQTNTNALPNAIQENGLTTLQDYQQGINPLTGASFSPTNLYYQASSSQDIINVEFTANSTADAVGPAAAGYSSNDYWNCWSSRGTRRLRRIKH